MAIVHVNTKCDIPSGFRWGTAKAAIKRAGREDIGLLVADNPCSAAAVFTRNTFCAAPVRFSRGVLSRSGGKLLGAVVNSGCANAATGARGMDDAATMARLAETALCRGPAESEPQFLVCSTGVIGVHLPMDKIQTGIETAARELDATADAFNAFARSILTTDTVAKIASARIDCGNKTARILGCAKGAGMIYPRMATLLAFITTDAEVEPDLLKECFARTVEHSLNCLTVDGDTSTNDTAILLASGASELKIDPASAELVQFEKALLDVMQSLTKQLARDGEGASKLVEIEVQRAANFESARKIGFAIANSNLVKTAIYGKDANWGRIICAVGNSGEMVDPATVRVSLGPQVLFEAGAPVPMDEQAALEALSQDCVRIEVDLGVGQSAATVWTCDLTEGYIKINGAYRT